MWGDSLIYDDLLQEAYEEGLIVKEYPLKYNDGRLQDNRIAIRQDISTTTEKACILAEELGHYYTATGNILNQKDAGNRKPKAASGLIITK